MEIDENGYYELCGNTSCVQGRVGGVCSLNQGICQTCGGSGYVATSKGQELLEFLRLFRKATNRGEHG